MDDKLIRLARKVKTLEDELSKITQIKDLDGLLLANSDMSSRYRKSIAETVGVYKDYISNTKKELQDSLKAIQKEQTEKHTTNKKNIDSLEAKLNKVKDDILNVSTSINKSIEDIQKDILKDIKDKNNQILLNLDKKDKELKEVKKENTALNKDLKALKALVEKLELQKGDDGKSAYDIACELGFKGTKEEWIKSLHGKDGQDIELRGLRAFSDVKNDNKMYARKNKKWVEVEEYDDTELRNKIEALQTENTRLKATLPTTTGEGENITLSKTAELEFIQPPFPGGNSEQVQYSGYNLFNAEKIIQDSNNSDIYIIDNEYIRFKTGPQKCIIKPNTIEENTAYTFKLILKSNVSTTNTIGISAHYTDGTEKQLSKISRTDTSEFETVFSTDGSKTLEYLYTENYSNQEAYIKINGSMIVKGTYTSANIPSYEPYVGGTASPNPSYPQAITNVTGDVEVLVQNKNWFNETYYNDSTLYAEGEAGTRYFRYVEMPDSFKTSFYGNVFLRGTSQNLVAGFSTSQTGATDRMLSGGTITNNVHYDFTNAEHVYFVIGNSSGVDASRDVPILFNNYNIQVTKDTATTYTPHQEQTLPLTLGNIELRKIGDYQDYFYKENNKWYLHKAIGKVVYNGSENWGVAGEGNTTDGVSMYLGISDALSSAYKEVYCNYFKYINRNYVSSSSLNFITGGGGVSIVINASKEYLSEGTTTGFKTWLGTHNITVLYPLATPTITEILDTTLINQLEAISNAISYEEQTNISGSSDESNPLFSVEAYQSIKLVLAS